MIAYNVFNIEELKKLKAEKAIKVSTAQRSNDPSVITSYIIIY